MNPMTNSDEESRERADMEAEAEAEPSFSSEDELASEDDLVEIADEDDAMIGWTEAQDRNRSKAFSAIFGTRSGITSEPMRGSP